MKTASNLFLAAALVRGASCQRLLQNIPEVGLGPMMIAGGDSAGRYSVDEYGDDGSTMEQDLIEALEVDDQVTGKLSLSAAWLVLYPSGVLRYVGVIVLSGQYRFESKRFSTVKLRNQVKHASLMELHRSMFK